MAAYDTIPSPLIGTVPAGSPRYLRSRRAPPSLENRSSGNTPLTEAASIAARNAVKVCSPGSVGSLKTMTSNSASRSASVQSTAVAAISWLASSATTLSPA